jgi:hypothetical protein
MGTWEPMTGAHVREPFYHTVEADRKSVPCRGERVPEPMEAADIFFQANEEETAVVKISHLSYRRWGQFLISSHRVPNAAMRLTVITCAKGSSARPIGLYGFFATAHGLRGTSPHPHRQGDGRRNPGWPTDLDR